MQRLIVSYILIVNIVILQIQMKNRYNVPQDKRRACLCRDRDTYSRECCEGDYINQGIGSITKDETE